MKGTGWAPTYVGVLVAATVLGLLPFLGLDWGWGAERDIIVPFLAVVFVVAVCAVVVSVRRMPDKGHAAPAIRAGMLPVLGWCVFAMVMSAVELHGRIGWDFLGGAVMLDYDDGRVLLVSFAVLALLVPLVALTYLKRWPYTQEPEEWTFSVCLLTAASMGTGWLYVLKSADGGTMLWLVAAVGVAVLVAVRLARGGFAAFLAAANPALAGAAMVFWMFVAGSLCIGFDKGYDRVMPEDQGLLVVGAVYLLISLYAWRRSARAHVRAVG